MRELRRILQLWKAASANAEPCVLATVVKTHGSSYRMPGARLLLTKSGERAGSVSGGCLEDELIRKAWWLTEAGPVIRRYDTHSDEDGHSGFGLGCNGIIHLLLERLTPGETNLLDVLDRVRLERRPAAAMHLLDAPGELLVLGPTDTNASVLDRSGSRKLKAEAERLLSERCSQSVFADGREAFAEYIAPPVRLLIIGAGDDAVPLADLARYLGWTVSVFDGRAHYAPEGKFHHDVQVTVGPVGQTIHSLAMDPWTVAVLMSHSYSQDLDALGAFKDAWPRYLGILGPRRRTDQLIVDSGLSADRLSRDIHSPIGLDLGADGPEQVALAVTSEISAVLKGRSAGFLRDRSGPIHDRREMAEYSEVWTGSAVCR